MKKLFFFMLLLGTCTLHAQIPYVTTKNIPYYPDTAKTDEYMSSRCVLDIYYPKGKKNFSTIVWFHGGGMTQGQKEIPEKLMNKGYAVIAVNYRLSPKVVAPAYIEDAAAAVAWAFNNISKFGGNPDLIFVSGHSAGGYLGMMVTLDKKYLAKYQIDANRIAALIPFSGQAITHFTVRQEHGLKDTKVVIDEYAPLYFARGDAPPMLLITGDREKEMLGRYEENAYLARMMKLTGHTRTVLYELDGFDHGGMAEPAFPLLLKEVSAVSAEILGKK